LHFCMSRRSAKIAFLHGVSGRCGGAEIQFLHSGAAAKLYPGKLFDLLNFRGFIFCRVPNVTHHFKIDRALVLCHCLILGLSFYCRNAETGYALSLEQNEIRQTLIFRFDRANLN
jgi:hypothetical protein